MPTIEGLRLKMLKFPRLLLADRRQSKLLYKDFTIISNNCWGGMIYESYNLQKLTPTVGLYFMASDYIKFISNIKKYVLEDLVFISPKESKWLTSKETQDSIKCPIARLDDIEIYFLHYHSEEEARDKWTRRCSRINWDRILFKFNDQNGCTEEDLKAFINLPYKNKVFFTCKEWNIKHDCIVKINQFANKEHVMASYEPFGKSRYININELINSL